MTQTQGYIVIGFLGFIAGTLLHISAAVSALQ